jgi:hypothetical protein
VIKGPTTWSNTLALWVPETYATRGYS